MNDNRTSGMPEELRLTRGGQLEKALAAMQRSLGSARIPPLPGVTGTSPGLSALHLPLPNAASACREAGRGAPDAAGLLGKQERGGQQDGSRAAGRP